MLNTKSIIEAVCGENEMLCSLLLLHCGQVRDKALWANRRHPELGMDDAFIEEAAMLHDVGIVFCDAPTIFCYGTEPYLKHGVLGADLLRRKGLPKHARVCERHTGTGLTREYILRNSLPVPPQDLIPETLEEQVICYADKFYSKTHPEEEKTREQVLSSLRRFGGECEGKFRLWEKIFG